MSAAATRGPTQAIVLAAGEGRRLRPITLTTPKPLVPFYGRPLIDWAVAKLVAAGVTRIAVNAFYLADAIAAYVTGTLAHAHPHVDFHVSREPALLGTGGAVRYLRDWLTPGEPFYVLNSDAVFAAPVDALVVAAAAAASPSDPRAALLVTRDPAYAAERRLVVDDNHRWVGLDEAGRPESGLTFCGLTLADPELPARLPDGASCILRQGFVPALADLAVTLVPTDDFFADTGTPRALIEAHVRGRAWVEASYSILFAPPG